MDKTLRGRRLMVLVVAPSLVAASLGLLRSADSASAAPNETTRTYAAAAASVSNPDRGFFDFTSTTLAPGGAGHVPLDLSELQAAAARGRTVVFRAFYLDGYQSTDAIDPADLALISTDLDTVRQAGMKLVVRFAYSQNTQHDAPVARTVGHIQQIAPVLNAHADVILSLQAGFIGRWGEWYYSDNYLTDQSTPWNPSADDWVAREQVLDALIDGTDPSIRIQVRYPAIVKRLLPTADARNDRVGVHNDCFLADYEDQGTYQDPVADRSWLATRSTTSVVGGETCAVNGTHSQWPSASAELARFHWTYLNADFNPDVLASWGTAGLEEADRRLGYRLRLTSATLPTQAQAGSTATVSFTLVNDGYAAPLQQRPVRIVMRNGADVRTAPVVTDTRTWQPGSPITVTANVTVPSDPGDYDLYLDLPDSAASLQSTTALPDGRSTHAAYAVQLANVGTWDATDGWNDLQHTMTATAAPAPAPVSNPAPSATAVDTPAPTSSPTASRPPSPATALPAGVQRARGATRNATAVDASRRVFPHDGQARSVVVVNSGSYPDAVVGARLAAEVGAPLLLSGRDELDDSTTAEIRRVLGPGGSVYVVGGPTAISSGVADGLQTLTDGSVIRLSGRDRYATAVAASARTAGEGSIYVADGGNHADALAAAALAAADGGVLLLTDGPTMPEATRAYLQAHDPTGTRTVAIGGPAARAVPGARAVVGEDRFATAALVSDLVARRTGTSVVGIASADHWADGVVAAAAMGNLGGSVLLTGAALPQDTKLAIQRLPGARAALLVGGSAAIPDSTAREVDDLV